MMVVKIKDKSIPVLFAIAVLPFLIPLIGRLGGASVNVNSEAIALVGMGMFVAIEVGILGLLKSKGIKKDPLRALGGVVALSAMSIGIILLAGLTVTIPTWLMTGTSSLLALYAIVEAFRN